MDQFGSVFPRYLARDTCSRFDNISLGVEVRRRTFVYRLTTAANWSIGDKAENYTRSDLRSYLYNHLFPEFRRYIFGFELLLPNHTRRYNCPTRASLPNSRREFQTHILASVLAHNFDIYEVKIRRGGFEF